jgi:hypothetical protein
LQRFRDVLDTLRAYRIRHGWSVDEEAAAKALAYFEGRLAGTVDDDLPIDESGADDAMTFLHDHGQPLDYVFIGDVRAMFVKLAHHSQRAAECAARAADPIFAAIEACRRTRAAADKLHEPFEALCEEDGKSPGYHRSPARNAAYDAWDAASEVELRAMCELAQTVPTTIAGALAAVAFLQSYLISIEENERDDEDIVTIAEDESGTFSTLFLETIAIGLDNIGRTA